MSNQNLNKYPSTSRQFKGKGCLKKVVLAGLLGAFTVFVCWQLLRFGINRMYFGDNPYQIPTPYYSPAAVSTRQLYDKLFISLPNSSVIVEMVNVPAGEFSMGSNEESPIHDTYLDEFWIDKTEVTNAQFEIFVQTTGYETLAEQKGISPVFDNNLEPVEGANWQHPQGLGSSIEGLSEHPVVQISWYDALAFCQWRGARLPTEAEWEKAARGVDSRIYPWGNHIVGTELNYCDSSCVFHKDFIEMDDGYPTTAPVNSFPNGISPYGAVDMAGNVMEYTADWYGNYEQSPQINPTGPETEDILSPNLLNRGIGGLKVKRGGAWISIHPDDLTADFRNTTSVEGRTDYTGFRCAYAP
ncbi:MAG: formylglycine-generating enzyme family protein [Chloroflexi bacterium]|nr:formylglycine-generating enzyme family protein [Chloroflexota bacterium]